MKMKITIEIENADGLKEIKPIVIDTEIPEFEEFKSPDNFREVFHKYETVVLKARNMAAELATEEYLAELSKKTYERVGGKANVEIEKSRGYTSPTGILKQKLIGYCGVLKSTVLNREH